MGEHRGEDLKGRLKVAAGDVTGDEALRREGKVDRASAATKRTVENVADKVRDAVNPKK